MRRNPRRHPLQCGPEGEPSGLADPAELLGVDAEAAQVMGGGLAALPHGYGDGKSVADHGEDLAEGGTLAEHGFRLSVLQRTRLLVHCTPNSKSGPAAVVVRLQGSHAGVAWGVHSAGGGRQLSDVRPLTYHALGGELRSQP